MPTIEKVYVRDVITLDASTSCQDAAHLMEARRIGSVGVLEDNRWLIEQLHTYIRGGRGG